LLPEEKRKAIAAIAMGPAIKLVFRFASAFWEDLHDGAYRDAAFFHSPSMFSTFWTTVPLRSAELVAWTGGTNAMRLMNVSEEDVISQALDSLAILFGNTSADLKRRLEATYLHDWQRDSFSRGAYSYVKVGGDDARAALAAPLASSLFFAGEATATNGEAGTVGGALHTGLRAARQAADALA
jgi:monoamine oxidase